METIRKSRMKKMKKEKIKGKGEVNLKSQKAITLIALVITIIVLLILAAVSIATLTGENGILTRGEQRKNRNKRSKCRRSKRFMESKPKNR